MSVCPSLSALSACSSLYHSCITANGDGNWTHTPCVVTKQPHHSHPQHQHQHQTRLISIIFRLLLLRPLSSLWQQRLGRFLNEVARPRPLLHSCASVRDTSKPFNKQHKQTQLQDGGGGASTQQKQQGPCFSSRKVRGCTDSEIVMNRKS